MDGHFPQGKNFAKKKTAGSQKEAKPINYWAKKLKVWSGWKGEDHYKSPKNPIHLSRGGSQFPKLGGKFLKLTLHGKKVSVSRRKGKPPVR